MRGKQRVSFLTSLLQKDFTKQRNSSSRRRISFVAHGPEGVDNFIDQGRLYSRMKRGAGQAQAEKNRLAYQKLADKIDVDSAGVSIVRDRRPGEQGDGER